MSELRVDVAGVRGETRLQLRFAVPKGAITALVGPSGSGKTSLLRMIAGLDRPQRGRITLGDTAWFDSEEEVDLPVQYRGAGVVFQDYALFPHLTAAENIAYGVPRRERQLVASQWLARMELLDSAQRYPRQLSGGQRQRVALARTLAARPRLLLLDEPFSALDVELRIHLHGVLRTVLAELDCPALLVTHDPGEVRELAHQVITLASGHVQGGGCIASTCATPPTREVAAAQGWGAGRERHDPDGLTCFVCGGPRAERRAPVPLRHDDCTVISEGM